MKSNTIIIATISLIFIIVVLLFLMPSRDIKQVGENTMLGNNYTNLLVGGKVAKNGDIIYYSCSSKNGLFNNILTYDLRTEKTKSLKTFVTIPTELCALDDYVFFKKGAAHAAESPLYRMNISTKKCKKVISKSIRRYNIYFNKVYYTVESPTSSDDVGLFQCDIDGKNKKRIIHAEVDEFVILGNDIYYIQDNSIRHYNIVDGTDVEIISHSKCSLYHLTINKEELFYVKTDDMDYDKESLVRVNLNDNSETFLYDGKCGLIHIIDDMVVFRGDDDYYTLDLSDFALTSFAETYNIKEVQEITELYFFDSQCFFFVGIGNGEKLIHLNLKGKGQKTRDD